MTPDISNTPKQPSGPATEAKPQQQAPGLDLSNLSNPEQFGSAIDTMLNNATSTAPSQQSTLAKFGGFSVGAVSVTFREGSGS